MDEPIRPPRGKFIVDDTGTVKAYTDPETGLPVLPAPDGVITPPTALVKVAAEYIQGWTRVYEWLMVDVRIARMVPKDSELFRVCQNLTLRGEGGIGLESSTLIIDLMELSDDDRAVVLNPANWPTPRA